MLLVNEYKRIRGKWIFFCHDDLNKTLFFMSTFKLMLLNNGLGTQIIFHFSHLLATSKFFH